MLLLDVAAHYGWKQGVYVESKEVARFQFGSFLVEAVDLECPQSLMTLVRVAKSFLCTPLTHRPIIGP